MTTSKELVKKALLENPEMNDGQIADLLDISLTTARKYRNELGIKPRFGRVRFYIKPEKIDTSYGDTMHVVNGVLLLPMGLSVKEYLMKRLRRGGLKRNI